MTLAMLRWFPRTSRQDVARFGTGSGPPSRALTRNPPTPRSSEPSPKRDACQRLTGVPEQAGRRTAGQVPATSIEIRLDLRILVGEHAGTRTWPNGSSRERLVGGMHHKGARKSFNENIEELRAQRSYNAFRTNSPRRPPPEIPRGNWSRTSDMSGGLTVARYCFCGRPP